MAVAVSVGIGFAVFAVAAIMTEFAIGVASRPHVDRVKNKITVLEASRSDGVVHNLQAALGGVIRAGNEDLNVGNGSDEECVGNDTDRSRVDDDNVEFVAKGSE